MTADVIPLRPEDALRTDDRLARLLHPDCDGKDICADLNSEDLFIALCASRRVQPTTVPSDIDEWLAEARWRDDHPAPMRLRDLPRRYWLGLAVVSLWPLWAWLAALIISAGH